MNEATGRVACVTGGATGIGRRTVERLAAQGHHMIIHYAHSAIDAEALAASVAADHGVEATTLKADLTERGDADALADAALAWKGRVDILVNNAAVIETPIDKTTSDADLLDHLGDWDRVVNANLRAPLVLASRMARAMKERGEGGRIVNVASVAGMYALTDAPLYSLTKSGLLHLTRQLAQLYAPHVQVNAVAPGWTATGFGGGFILDPAFQKQVSRGIPMKRVAEVDEVAEVIEWLATGARYVTGTMVTVDGGMVSELR